MGILSRMSRIVKSNLNDILDRAENPEKMLTQCIADMEDSLREAKEGIARSMADEKKLQKQLSEARTMEQRWHEKAEDAVASGQDNLAREALKKRQLYARLVQDYERELEEQRSTVTSLKEQYKELTVKLQEARDRRRSVLTRSERSRGRASDEESYAGRRQAAANKVYDTRAFDEFDRMASKVEDFDYMTQATRELDQELGEGGPTRRGQRERRERDEDLAVDMELEALRKKAGREKTPDESSRPEDEDGEPHRRVEL
jgi:phage shock protein A